MGERRRTDLVRSTVSVLPSVAKLKIFVSPPPPPWPPAEPLTVTVTASLLAGSMFDDVV